MVGQSRIELWADFILFYNISLPAKREKSIKVGQINIYLELILRQILV